MQKSTVLESISNLPDNVSIDEIVETLIIVEKIDRAHMQIQEGKLHTEEEARAILGKWLS
jgi:hypothetical protein